MAGAVSVGIKPQPASKDIIKSRVLFMDFLFLWQDSNHSVWIGVNLRVASLLIVRISSHPSQLLFQQIFLINLKFNPLAAGNVFASARYRISQKLVGLHSASKVATLMYAAVPTSLKVHEIIRTPTTRLGENHEN
jgi:hypothetical protein